MSCNAEPFNSCRSVRILNCQNSIVFLHVADEEISSLLQNLSHLHKASFKPLPKVDGPKGSGEFETICRKPQLRHIALLHFAASAAYYSLVNISLLFQRKAANSQSYLIEIIL